MCHWSHLQSSPQSKAAAELQISGHFPTSKQILSFSFPPQEKSSWHHVPTSAFTHLLFRLYLAVLNSSCTRKVRVASDVLTCSRSALEVTFLLSFISSTHFQSPEDQRRPDGLSCVIVHLAGAVPEGREPGLSWLSSPAVPAGTAQGNDIKPWISQREH